jgi:DNA-binding IclR family transcriptional regulator
MKHLDPCLASAFGRTILQHLPPDALATLLGSDQLALLSENTTLAAIDVWLAGPVASSLAAAPAQAAGVASDASQEPDASDMVGCSSDGSSSRLAAALQLLVRQVRLPLCSGAFLAAAVSQRPWLCLGMQGSHELALMQQYYG